MKYIELIVFSTKIILELLLEFLLIWELYLSNRIIINANSYIQERNHYFIYILLKEFRFFIFQPNNKFKIFQVYPLYFINYRIERNTFNK